MILKSKMPKLLRMNLITMHKAMLFLACKNDTHTDGYILSDRNAIFFTVFQCEDDISLDVHKLCVFEKLHPKVHPIIEICNDIKRYFVCCLFFFFFFFFVV